MSSEQRWAAEHYARALPRLACELDAENVFLAVLGGLVPDVPASDDGLIPKHLGTTDVDVLLITHVEPQADLSALSTRPDARRWLIGCRQVERRPVQHFQTGSRRL